MELKLINYYYFYLLFQVFYLFIVIELIGRNLKWGVKGIEVHVAVYINWRVIDHTLINFI